jgi:hypothetical protein
LKNPTKNPRLITGPMGRTLIGVKLGPGLSFSPKRALGITKLKRSIAKASKVPTTRTGRRAKLGRLFKMR